MISKNIAKTPPPLRGPPEKRNPKKYCTYHQSHGHDTEDCNDLKRDIDAAVAEGKLPEVIDQSTNPEPKGRRNFKRKNHYQDRGKRTDNQKRQDLTEHDRYEENRPVNHVGTIFGPSEVNVGETSSDATRKKIKLTTEVGYGPADPLPSVLSNEGLVIEVVVSRNRVGRVCIDNGSAVNIIYHAAFRAMNLKEEDVLPMSSPLFGFTGQAVHPMGSIRLLTTFGEEKKGRTLEVDYVVVKAPSAYNVIMGRPALVELRAIISPAHNSMKFPTWNGACEIKGDAEVAKSCYSIVMSGKTMVQQVLVEELIPEDEDEKSWMSVDPVEAIRLWADDEARVIQIGAWIPEEQKNELIQLLTEFRDVFAWKADDMPGLSTDIAMHKLQVDKSRKPVKQKKRHFAQERNVAIKTEVCKLLQAKIVREVFYPEWVSNPVLVKKPDGTWRMCVDFTDLNKACPKDSYPLPKIDRLVDSTVGFEVFGFLDAYKGYHQILMDPEDAEKTAFITEDGMFCYTTMPFGLKNAGATYQRAVNKIFAKQIGRCMEVYVDDLLIKSKSLGEYMADVREVFCVLRESKMKLNPQKCTFGVRSGKFLGYMISKEGIRANPDKIDMIRGMPPPRSVKEVQRLTGRMAALNRFLSRSAQRALPFFKILRKANSFEWNDECQKAFSELKDYLADLPTLTSPQEGERLFIYLAVCEEAVSAVLVKEGEDGQIPIFFVSKALLGPETRYTPTEKLALALVHATRKLKPYFQAHSVTVVTDQPIKQILARPDTSGRLAKWVVELAEYDIQFAPRTTIKAQALADFLAEGVSIQIEQQQQGTTEQWTLHVDGASSKEGSGAGLLLESPKGELFPYALRFNFKATNNEAEYEAMITGLKLASKLGVDNLLVHSDSQLVVNHIKGEYEAKEEPMKRYLAVVKKLMLTFSTIQVEQVPRSQNKQADALSKLASNFLSKKRVLVESLDERSYNEKEVQPVMQKETWMDPIASFLKDGILPQDKIEARRLRLQGARYALHDSILYRKSFVAPWLRCASEDEAKYVLQEIHQGCCGSHCGARMLARKCKLAGYFWPTMHRDAVDLVQKCRTCQIFDNVPHQQSQEMFPMASAWPFDQWGVDIVGPLIRAPGNFKFVVVAIDYYTRWVEAKALTNIRAETIKKFLWTNILCRYGIPKVLVSDNGTQFEDRKVKAWCAEYKIKQHFSAVHHPQANGQVEQANRQIKKGIKKRLKAEGRDWVAQLPSVLWAYRTAPNVATGETPFSLTYGCEAVIPAEIGLPSPRMLTYHPEVNRDALQEEKDALEEKRSESALRSARYKQKISQYYNTKVRTKVFKVGDLVLRKNAASRQEGEGKLDPNWEGPYQILKVLNKGSYQLGRADGTAVPRAWHANNLRKYYA